MYVYDTSLYPYMCTSSKVVEPFKLVCSPSDNDTKQQYFTVSPFVHFLCPLMFSNISIGVCVCVCVYECVCICVCVCACVK